ncbi:hypothetical protein [Micromonospora sp. HK10]|uniref:hypothetical protein n=1 Tax=Micromonospora sp. HK10 TaxID=1538294 RepID=UPI0006271E06|nr:hypothetical protein [Micromonospora sp. HK10]KKK00568.1 hypothetical protein LQ51_21190 [Micromonospora sp. HK10]
MNGVDEVRSVIVQAARCVRLMSAAEHARRRDRVYPARLFAAAVRRGGSAEAARRWAGARSGEDAAGSW